MSKITRNIIGTLSRFKFAITIFFGMLVVGVIDDNSFITLLRYRYEVKDLKADIQKYKLQYEEDTNKLRAMKSDPKTIARIARERYFMKADDEDIFVLNDDEAPIEITEE